MSSSFWPLGLIAHQVPLSMEFSRQEYWSGLPFSSPGDLRNSGIKPRSPTLQADSLPSEPPEPANNVVRHIHGSYFLQVNKCLPINQWSAVDFHGLLQAGTGHTLSLPKWKRSWGTGARLLSWEVAQPVRKTQADSQPRLTIHFADFSNLPALLCNRGSRGSERLSHFPKIPQLVRRLKARSQTNQLSVCYSFQLSEKATSGEKKYLWSPMAYSRQSTSIIFNLLPRKDFHFIIFHLLLIT